MDQFLHDFWHNFRANLFKPLLLFFYMGFAVPILNVNFEFPPAVYQGLTLYLLVSIGWRGGEELAQLLFQSKGITDPALVGHAVEHVTTGPHDPHMMLHALEFMAVGFVTNCVIGVVAYFLLRSLTKLRQIDAATVAGYYGSDSAGTFVTCVGVLTTAQIAYAAYMPVMLAVMEIPGCLVALFLISRQRERGMDALGNMPGEPHYDPSLRREPPVSHAAAHGDAHTTPAHASGKAELFHEVFFNPGLFLLFGGIFIGFVSALQGKKVVEMDDKVFNDLFQGALCLFLLEMGMTASRRLKDLKTAGWSFIAFGILAPNLFAAIGLVSAHSFSNLIGVPLELGTYVLFAVLCGAASYIAVPAIQRLAIPEASPTLPLAAALGLTFSYNVTIGIPIYLELAKYLINRWPVA